MLRPLGGTDDEVAGVFPALEQVSPAIFPPPDPGDAATAASAGLLRTALRIGFRSSAGPFRSLAWLAVEPRAYQLVPLLMALRQDTVRLLIADDVGIGKTIEAGLIAAELLEQGDASGLAVLCGPALAEQWQRELASQVRHRRRAGAARHDPPAGARPAARRDAVRPVPAHRGVHRLHQAARAARAVLARCPDLVIVDEAHTCVVRRHRRPVAELRHELVTGLAADASRHLILVTATPHSGKDEAFRNLLGLLDPGPGTRRPRDGRRAGNGWPATSCSAAAPTSASYLDEDTPFPEDRLTQERPYALSRPTGSCSTTCSPTPARPSATPRAASCGSGSGTGRRWRCCARWPPRRARPPQTLRTRAANLDAERRGRGRPARPLRRARPGRRGDRRVGRRHARRRTATPPTGDTPHRRRLRRFAARAASSGRRRRRQARSC